MDAILDIGTEQLSNSESPCHPDASHQVLAQSDLQFGRRCGLISLLVDDSFVPEDITSSVSVPQC